MSSELSRFGVVGCGLMGSGIAEIAARAGLDVVVAESSVAARDAGEARMRASLARAEAKGKLTGTGGTTAEEVMKHVRVTDDLRDLADRQMVIEAVIEDEAAKTAVFGALDEVVTDRDAILATNTSSLPVTRLGMATSRPERVVGTHFFNPVPVLPLVEVVPSLLTASETVDATRALLEGRLGKTVIGSQDRAGFVVNALLVPFLLSAVRMLESGRASAEDIDRGLVLGAAHPQGPLALIDLIGLDTLKLVADCLYAEFREPHYAPPALLARMVEAGLLGRKSGRGFFAYDR